MPETQALTVRPRSLPAHDLTAHIPWSVVLAAYLDSAMDSPHTRRAYQRHAQTALEYIGKESLADVTGADLAAYRAELLKDGRGPASYSQALAALRAFLSWSRTFGAHAIPGDVVREALRSPKGEVLHPYQVLSETEIGPVFAASKSARDKALLAVLLGGGLRAAEAAGLDVQDILEDTEGETALHVRGKGRRDRIVPTTQQVAQIIRSYLAESGRTLGAKGPLFLAYDRGADTRDGKRLSTRSVGSIVVGAARRAGVSAKRISPHSLRHTFAIRALRKSGNVVAVSKLLGHASVATTQRYVDHLELSELRETVPELPL